MVHVACSLMAFAVVTLDHERVLMSKHCTFPCRCSKLHCSCSSLLHGFDNECVTVASRGLTVLFVQVHSPQLHCWTANHPYAFPCLKMSLLLHMGMPLSTCTASCIKCMSINSAANNSIAISPLSFAEINTYDSTSCGTTQVCFTSSSESGSGEVEIWGPCQAFLQGSAGIVLL